MTVKIMTVDNALIQSFTVPPKHEVKNMGPGESHLVDNNLVEILYDRVWQGHGSGREHEVAVVILEAGVLDNSTSYGELMV